MSDYKQKYKYYKYKYLQLAGAETEGENLIKIEIRTLNPDIEDKEIYVKNDATVGTVKQRISTEYGHNRHYIVLDLITDTIPESDEIAHLVDDISIRSLPVLSTSGLRTLYATFLPPKSETDILLELKSVNDSLNLKPLNWSESLELKDWLGVGLDDKGMVNVLQLNSMDVSVIPESIAGLSNLEQLDLEDNNIEHLPNNIGYLTNLTYLDLGYNRLNTLPESIGHLYNLDTLNLRNNQLTTLPNSITKLHKLTKLYIAANHLTTLPNNIGDLYQLIVLDLRLNNLNTLPETIGNLVNLQTLKFSNNNLGYLPKSIERLTKLKSLGLIHSETNNKLLKPLDREFLNTIIQNNIKEGIIQTPELTQLINLHLTHQFQNIDVVNNSDDKPVPSMFQTDYDY